ncbi:MAG: hypothetical protein IKZ54_08935 [Bacteroidales bacterium]|nr:hypothetical protein [Bacteroidales bacterium]
MNKLKELSQVIRSSMIILVGVVFTIGLFESCRYDKAKQSIDDSNSTTAENEFQKNNEYGIDESTTSNTISYGIDDFTSSSNQINYKRAAIVAHDFVEEKMGKCKWNIHDIRGEEMSDDNQFMVMEKFTRDGKEYIYKIIIKYFGNDDDWAETKNWDYSQLTIENVSTGKQSFYYGNLKDRERKKDAGKTIQVDGVTFTLLEKNLPNYVSFSHKGTLKRNQIANALLKIKEQYDCQIIYLFRYPKSEAGEDYLCYQYGCVFDNEHNKAYNSLNDYKNNK